MSEKTYDKLFIFILLSYIILVFLLIHIALEIEEVEKNQLNFQEYTLNILENSRIEWNDIGCKAREINQS